MVATIKRTHKSNAGGERETRHLASTKAGTAEEVAAVAASSAAADGLGH